MPRTGRPRRDGRAVAGDPTDEILRAAAHLFEELGVGGTTMARIAADAGLGQSSLYYYFRSKEEIVAELVARANVVPLKLGASLTRWDGSPAAKLYLFVKGDVEALCALPFDINEAHRIAARDRERFAPYWSERRRLEKLLGAIVRAGITAGELRDVDPSLTALTLMSNDEGVQNWYRLGSNRKPAVAAQALAEMMIGGLLTRKRSLGDVAKEADQAEL
ncbi:MAG: TetR/AcrR family transcriptional regulator [Acidimicrobiales bacterium]|nr:TetR/AcrR family transcriptional regulator [Acidimicrobiales bacterium]